MASLSKNQNKHIRSLARKKDRNETGLFLVEGDKMVREVLSPSPGCIHFELQSVVSTDDWLAEFGGIIPRGIEHFSVGAAELRQVSTLQEPNGAIALVRQADYRPDISKITGNLSIGLENIQDPGNLGTIIRIADWFGIRDVFCSPESVELYNPKVIQSTMGSFLRVRVHHFKLDEIIRRIREGSREGSRDGTGDATRNADYYPVFATGGMGSSLYETDLPDKGIFILGNESKGLSDKLMAEADQVLSIPHHDPGLHPESLNVAAATAILCAEFRRQSARS